MLGFWGQKFKVLATHNSRNHTKSRKKRTPPSPESSVATLTNKSLLSLFRRGEARGFHGLFLFSAYRSLDTADRKTPMSRCLRVSSTKVYFENCSHGERVSPIFKEVASTPPPPLNVISPHPDRIGNSVYTP